MGRHEGHEGRWLATAVCVWLPLRLCRCNGHFSWFLPAAWPICFSLKAIILLGGPLLGWRVCCHLWTGWSCLLVFFFSVHRVHWHQQEHHAAALAGGASKEKSNPLPPVLQLVTLVHPLGATAFIPDTPNSISWLFSPCLPVWFDLLFLYHCLLLSFSLTHFPTCANSQSVQSTGPRHLLCWAAATIS